MPKRKHCEEVYPCIECGVPCNNRRQSIDCDVCGQRQHRTCGVTGVSQAQYRAARRGELQLAFVCVPCSAQVPDSPAESTRILDDLVDIRDTPLDVSQVHNCCVFSYERSTSITIRIHQLLSMYQHLLDY